MSNRSLASALALALVVLLLGGLWLLTRGGGTATPTISPAPPSASVSPQAGDAVVVWIADGDTLDGQIDGVRTRIRLLNIDAPERAHDGSAAQCLADEATQALARLAPIGTTVHLTTYGNDRYGRLLAGVQDNDGRLINAELVRLGLAAPLVVGGQRALLEPVRAAQREAASGRLGLHGQAPCSLPGRISVARSNLDAAGAAPHDAALAAGKDASAEASAVSAELHADARDALVQGLTAEGYAATDAAASALKRDADALVRRLGG